jgi:hypothetical protein
MDAADAHEIFRSRLVDCATCLVRSGDRFFSLFELYRKGRDTATVNLYYKSFIILLTLVQKI